MTLIAERKGLSEEPLLSVAIPAYGNWDFLLIALDSVMSQTARDFEILVSEDAAPEDRTSEVVDELQASGLPYQVHRQERNLGYDGNVRFCLRTARGRHVLLLGHDDALASPKEIERIARTLEELDYPEVAFTNFEDWATGVKSRRAAQTGILGSGVDTALAHFRTFSFMSGLIYQRAVAARHDTDRWDTSIYIQIYLACRIMADGGRLASIARSSIRKDILIEEHTVDSYATKLAAQSASFRPRHTGIDSVVRVTYDAVGPYLEPPRRRRALRRITGDVLAYSYLYWLLEYRRLGGITAGIGVARTSVPSELLRGLPATPLDKILLTLLYSGITVIGLCVPTKLAMRLTGKAAAMLRRRRQAGVT